MDLYKKAAIDGTRVQTKRGSLSAEQLYTLDVNDLNDAVVALDAEIEKAPKKSYLTKTSVSDLKLQHKRDLVLDILQTKIAAEEAATNAAEIKAHNKKIDALIAQQDEKALQGMSKEELLKLKK